MILKEMGRMFSGLLIAILFLTASEASGVERFNLSVSDLKIENSERITGFDVTLLYGSVFSIPRIPPGWSMKIDVNHENKTVVTAEAGWGVAWLNADEVNFFSDFLILVVNEEERRFLSIDIAITTINCSELVQEKQDNCVRKRYVFKTEDLKLRRLK